MMGTCFYRHFKWVGQSLAIHHAQYCPFVPGPDGLVAHDSVFGWIIQGGPDGLVAHDSVFGWIIQGVSQNS